MSRISNVVEERSMRSNSTNKGSQQQLRQLALLTEQLEQMTEALKKKQEEIAFWKQKARALEISLPQSVQESPKTARDQQDIDRRLQSLMSEIMKLNQLVESKQSENDRQQAQFAALQNAYVELNQQHQQAASQAQMVANRLRGIEAENYQLKQQLAYIQNVASQLQSHQQQLISQNSVLQQAQLSSQNKHQQELDALHGDYKHLLEQKSDEIIILKNTLDTNKSKDEEIYQIKAKYEAELRAQKDISREMLQHEETRVRRDESDKWRTKYDDLLDENTRLKNQQTSLQDQRSYAEQQLFKLRQQSQDSNQDLLAQNQILQTTVQQLQNEIVQADKTRQNNSFSSVFDTTTQFKQENIQRELEAKNREIQELTYQCSLMREQVQKKIDIIVQLESENETLKEQNRQQKADPGANDPGKIQYLLNHIETLSKQLITPTLPTDLSQLGTPSQRNQDSLSEQVRSELYGVYPVTERPSIESSATNTQRSQPKYMELPPAMKQQAQFAASKTGPVYMNQNFRPQAPVPQVLLPRNNAQNYYNLQRLN